MSKSIERLRTSLVTALDSKQVELPPFPDAAGRVLALVGDDSVEPAVLSEIVQRDPGLVAAILRQANSSADGAAMRIVSVQQAVARLGLLRVMEIAVATSLRAGLFKAPRYPNLATTAWQLSLATALFAKEISRSLRRNVEIGYSCGLLWGVGRPLVLHALSVTKIGVPLPNDGPAGDLMDELAPQFAGAAGRTWELPPAVAAALDNSSEERPDEAAVAGLAENLAGRAIEKTEDQEFEANADSERLNLYPEDVSELLQLSDSIRSQLET